MLKVNNKDTRTTPLCTSVSIVNSEHVNSDWKSCSTIEALQKGVKYVQN